MIKVNIITSHNHSLFLHQLPVGKFPEYEFYENGDDSLNYNFVIVYEGILNAKTIKCNPENLIFISGEPPLSRIYMKSFLNQFHYIVSSHTSISHKHNILSQQSLPWHFGFDFSKNTYKYSFSELSDFSIPVKTKKMSIISSQKGMMPGHMKRRKFVDRLRAEFGNEIDFYGKGINPINDKSNAILPYYMTICIENSNIDNYWTEKIADAYLGYSIPVYYGCTNINQYFPDDSIVQLDLNNPDKSIDTIRNLLNNYQDIYNAKLTSILEARSLLLDAYNIFPMVVGLINLHKLKINNKPMIINLKPNHSYFGYKISYLGLKLKRFLTKNFL